MRMPTLFIFDMDGTMFDTEPISYRCWQEVCRQYGYVLPEDLFRSIIGMDNRRIAGVFRQHFGQAFPYEDIGREKVRKQLQYYSQNPIPVKPGLHELLRYAAAHSIRCAVASSSSMPQIEALLEKADIAAYFAVIESGECVARGKPEPDIFLHTCRCAGIAPSRALVLEDSCNGILAAYRAGIPSVLIPDLADVPEHVAKLAWRRCASLADVAGLFAAGGDR